MQGNLEMTYYLHKSNIKKQAFFAAAPNAHLDPYCTRALYNVDLCAVTLANKVFFLL